MSNFKLFDDKKEIVQIEEIHEDVEWRLPKVATKIIEFDGTAGKGAVGTINLFTVTGVVRGYVFGICSEDLPGSTATISVGVSGATASLIAQTTANDIDTGELWIDATPAVIETEPNLSLIKSNIIATVGTANITDGTITFYCVYYPIGSSVVS